MAGGGEGVGVEEAGNGGIVISALEVVEPGLSIVYLASGCD